MDANWIWLESILGKQSDRRPKQQSTKTLRQPIRVDQKNKKK